MDFVNGIKKLAEKIETFKGDTSTEEATKTAFILPFLRLLGYDDSNPTEIVPEFTADFGNRRDEKVDYAIMSGNKPIIIIECKHWNNDLKNDSPQLYRYFNASQAKFGILTNGIKYKFFSDLDEKNIMDKEPFFEFDFEAIKESLIPELVKFQKESFDIDEIFNSASDLKYSSLISANLEKELQDPSDDFVTLFAKRVYSSRFTSNALEQFRPIVRKVCTTKIKELVSERLNIALEKESEIIEEAQLEPESDSKIITTEEELFGFAIIKSIAGSIVDFEDIIYKDFMHHFSVFYKNLKQTICKLYLNKENKYIGIVNKGKQENKIPIDDLSEIYKQSELIISAIKSYQ